MNLNQSYTDYLQHTSASARPFPAACLEVFLLDQAQDRQHRREVDRLNEFAEVFDWKLTRDYEKALNDGYTLIVSNAARSILWVSHRFLAMTGYTPTEVIGRTPRFLQGPNTDPARIRELSNDLALAQCTKRTQPIFQRLVNYRKGGSPYLCDIEIDPIWNRQGELTHYIALEKEV
ncbi:PAS domain-containing protein [Larkinella sp. C7]|jgi:PAS domain S-box-containing protein|uniref:PAS domain-containing protein n=1 Tax=Larkinella sp. C7 TaxID=2576607 RepID=UPI0014861707|nr:PAS domain-containing protein [Larkinella sp. C7]